MPSLRIRSTPVLSFCSLRRSSRRSGSRRASFHIISIEAELRAILNSKYLSFESNSKWISINIRPIYSDTQGLNKAFNIKLSMTDFNRALFNNAVEVLMRSDSDPYASNILVDLLEPSKRAAILAYLKQGSAYVA